ncbi:methyltransferase domain-containing protein [Alkalicaulis satelles]|uniref:methyltransferase domain-containing protein n=1 Tax=Alkalicaulis satelles TaxID=2609175 RepID=UPI001E65DB8E|nr:methyltransferase domain-containing protein [Alkalicaulis satelles]
MAGEARAAAKAVETAEAYYDSHDADSFYAIIWGGEDIHVGLYEHPDEPIATASRRTVAHMASRLSGLTPGARVLDLGAGYGGAARYLAREHGAQVTCLNLSEVENARNRTLTREQGLEDRITVDHGAFEDLAYPDASFDIVWSQDAFLHSADRKRVLAGAARVVRPGGELIFTDPMQADTVADPAALKPVYERIHLSSLGSFAFYRAQLQALGLEDAGSQDMTGQLRNHYARVRAELLDRRDALKGEVSDAYVARMLEGLAHWVNAADQGLLAWGVIHYRKTR